MIDTHSHMFDSAFDGPGERDAALRRATAAGVGPILCPTIDSESHEAMLAMCAAHSDLCLPMMGLHPTSVNDNPLWEKELEIVERWLSAPPPAPASPSSSAPRLRWWAVGEVGLDLHWSRDFLTQQIAAFERQIELALLHDLPLVIHTREAWSEMGEVLERFGGRIGPSGKGGEGGRGLRGVLHAFSGSVDDYLRARSVGDFVVGVGGPVTWRRNPWRELLPAIDPAHIVLETDSPWLSPAPFRGQRNESAHLVYVRDAAAAILGLPPDELERITDENAARIFGI